MDLRLNAGKIKSRISLKKIKRPLVVCFLLLAIYLLIQPFLPLIIFSVNKVIDPDKFNEETYKDKYGISLKEDSERVKINDENITVLVIPKIGVEIDLSVDASDEALSQGAWVIPGSSQPGEEGQMVVTAHRYQFLPPKKNTFYNVDKLTPGDSIFVLSNGYAYKYEVSTTEIVLPHEFKFEGSGSEDNELVLFTCTPIWSATHRLIVYTKPASF